MPSDVPRRYKAAYAASTVVEIKKNVQLEPGEGIVFSARVQKRRKWLFMQPGILALTPQRLILLEHFLFSPDWILEIPRAAIVNLSAEQVAGRRWVNISYIGAGSTQSLGLRPLGFPGLSSSGEFQPLLDSLLAFGAGELKTRPLERFAPGYGPPADRSRYSSLTFLVILCLVLIFRVGQYYVRLPSEWRAKQAYDAAPSCTSTNLIAVSLARSGADTAIASSPPLGGAFCEVQEMTVSRIWSTRRAPYQHVALTDSHGRIYNDVGALNSVNRGLWFRMQPGERVYVTLAGDQLAWILHDGDLFETRENPDHNFLEQFTLMLVGTALCALLVAIYVFRKTLLRYLGAVMRPKIME